MGRFPIESVHSAGTDNAIYRLGDDMAVRLLRIRGAVGQVNKEHRWLPRLTPLLPLAIPVPLGKGALHRIDPDDGPRPGEHNSFRGVPLAERDASTRKAISSLDGTIDAGAATRAWEAALHAPVWDGPLGWIHGDLLAGNLLARQGRLSAVIDFGDLGVGDPPHVTYGRVDILLRREPGKCSAWPSKSMTLPGREVAAGHCRSGSSPCADDHGMAGSANLALRGTGPGLAEAVADCGDHGDEDRHPEGGADLLRHGGQAGGQTLLAVG